MIVSCSTRCALVCAVMVILLCSPQPSHAKERLLVGAITDSTKQKPLKARDTREWLEAAMVTSIRQAKAEVIKASTPGRSRRAAPL